MTSSRVIGVSLALVGATVCAAQSGGVPGGTGPGSSAISDPWTAGGSRVGNAANRSSGGGAGTQSPGDHASSSESRPTQANALRGKRAPLANPFTSYLSEWMTPGDYAVLRSTLTGSAPGPVSGGVFDSNRPFSLEFLSGESHAGTGLMPAEGRQKNPYLAGILAPGSLPQVNAPEKKRAPPVKAEAGSRPFAAPAAPASGSQNVNPASARSQPIPAFAKPLDDEKLFKPLKRF